MKIIASATCPVGDAAGHDADECRANLLEDGSILCVTCATRYPKMSEAARRIWRAIVSSGFNVPTVQLGSLTEPGTPAYSASCLSGYDPSQSDMVRACFTCSGESVRLSYERHNEAEIEKSDRTVGRVLSSNELAETPERIKRCVAALEAEGFRVRGFNHEIGKTITMTCGRPVGSMGYVLGLAVELSWRG